MLDHLGQVAQAAADKFGDKEALMFEGRSFSFRELNTMIEAAAAGLAGLGLAKGDVDEPDAERQYAAAALRRPIRRNGGQFRHAPH